MYQPNQLKFSRATYCRCGAGLAHPVLNTPYGHWECSKILLGETQPSFDHDGPYAFAFWSIPTENDKYTTRPEGPVDRTRLEQPREKRDISVYPDELRRNPMYVPPES